MNNNTIKSLAPVIVVVALAVSFAGGMATQKYLIADNSNNSNQAADGSSTQNGQGRFGGRQGARPTFGTVSSISDSSLEIKDRNGGTITVTLSDSTKYTNSNGDTAAKSDIKTGDTVVVIGSTGSDSKVTATQIRINPTMNGGPAGGSSDSSGSSEVN